MAGVSRKISAASARSHTRKSHHNTSKLPSGLSLSLSLSLSLFLSPVFHLVCCLMGCFHFILFFNEISSFSVSAAILVFVLVYVSACVLNFRNAPFGR